MKIDILRPCLASFPVVGWSISSTSLEQCIQGGSSVYSGIQLHVCTFIISLLCSNHPSLAEFSSASCGVLGGSIIVASTFLYYKVHVVG